MIVYVKIHELHNQGMSLCQEDVSLHLQLAKKLSVRVLNLSPLWSQAVCVISHQLLQQRSLGMAE